MKTKQQILRTVIEEIWVDMDIAANEVVLVVHWHGGQHSELRVKKQRRGETSRHTSPEAESVIRSLASIWEDDAIATQLNRMNLRTGEGNSWTSDRVYSFRYNKQIDGPVPGMDPSRVTLDRAAEILDVSPHRIRALIESGVLPARQAIKDAPWEISLTDLRSAAVTQAAQRAAPRRSVADRETPLIPGLLPHGAQ